MMPLRFQQIELDWGKVILVGLAQKFIFLANWPESSFLLCTAQSQTPDAQL